VMLVAGGDRFEIFRETPTHTCIIDGAETGARLEREMRAIVQRHYPATLIHPARPL
jgi:hypothetical protein